jgi:hypothetical protein
MVTVEGALAAAATLLALAFACSTFERWLDRRRRHELAWTISLLMFAAASAALWLGATIGWDAPTFRCFFLFGAILNVPWLAMGSVYLLYGQRKGDPLAAGLALLSAFAVGVMTVAPLKGPIPEHDLPQGKEVFGVLPRVLAGVCSGVAAIVVFALAMLSAYRLVRGRRRSARASTVAAPGRLAAGNLLIAAGTVVLSLSGTLNARLGEMEAFAITLVVGIALLFTGFLVATSASTARATPAARSAQDAPQDLAAHALR